MKNLFAMIGLSVFIVIAFSACSTTGVFTPLGVALDDILGTGPKPTPTKTSYNTQTRYTPVKRPTPTPKPIMKTAGYSLITRQPQEIRNTGSDSRSSSSKSSSQNTEKQKKDILLLNKKAGQLMRRGIEIYEKSQFQLAFNVFSDIEETHLNQTDREKTFMYMAVCALMCGERYKAREYYDKARSLNPHVLSTSITNQFSPNQLSFFKNL